jgi:hypothetical protein
VTQLAERADPTLRRRGVVYGIRTLDPENGAIVLGYVGQTFQALADREAQHREDQPWSDLIVDEAFVIACGWWTCAEIDAAEALYIRALRPTYNFEHNLDNPQRVPIWVARQQREQRDAVAGRAPWVPPHRPDARRPRRTTVQPRRRPARRRWPRPVRRLAWRAIVWLTLAATIFAAEPMSTPFATAAGSSVVLASAVMALPLLGRRRRRRRRR